MLEQTQRDGREAGISLLASASGGRLVTLDWHPWDALPISVDDKQPRKTPSVPFARGVVAYLLNLIWRNSVTHSLCGFLLFVFWKCLLCQVHHLGITDLGLLSFMWCCKLSA